MRMRAIAVGLAAVLVAPILVLVPLGEGSASAAISIELNGVVTCPSHAVTGVWVQLSGGGSKFAGWKPFNTSASDAYYSTVVTTTVPGALQLRVGCGGTTTNWGSTNYAPTVAVSGSHTQNVFCNGVGQCNLPSVGNKASGNLGDPLQCTQGALNNWHAYTGYWPLWSGDAAQWASTAKTNGYVVTTVAIPKSIVVFPATATNYAGHVAWVNSLSQSASGAITLNVTEENYDGTASNPTGHIRNWTYPASSSYHYIAA